MILQLFRHFTYLSNIAKHDNVCGKGTPAENKKKLDWVLSSRLAFDKSGQIILVEAKLCTCNSF